MSVTLFSDKGELMLSEDKEVLGGEKLPEIWNRFKSAIRERRLPWMRILVFIVGLLWLHSAWEKLTDERSH